MKYKVGLYIGRFQPFHKGHAYMARAALEQCDRLVIAIGSAQEERTEQNPFNIYERIAFIIDSLNSNELDRIIIIPIRDRENREDNSSWGEYLINEVVRQTNLRPEVCFTGEEQIRQHWFDTVEIDEVAISRSNIPISATKVREAVRTNDKKTYLSMVADNGIHWWKKIKEVLCNELSK